MKNPKYKIGDRILIRGEVKSIVQIQINIYPAHTSIYYYYESGCCLHEDHIVLAPKFNAGDTVYALAFQVVVKLTVMRTLSSDTFICSNQCSYNIEELYSTETEARAAIKLIDRT